MDGPALEALAGRLARRLIAHEIYLDAPALTALGSGELRVELRHGLCRHGLRWTPPLLVVARLRAMLQAELLTAGLALEELAVADVVIRIRLASQIGGRNGQMTWVGAGEEFIACTLDVEIRLATAAASGGFRQTFGLEWPRECRLWQLPPLPAPRGSGPAPVLP
jgi:hypothetical protein